MGVALIDLQALATMAKGNPEEAVPVTRRWLTQALSELEQHRRCGSCFGLPSGGKI